MSPTTFTCPRCCFSVSWGTVAAVLRPQDKHNIGLMHTLVQRQHAQEQPVCAAMLEREAKATVSGVPAEGEAVGASLSASLIHNSARLLPKRPVNEHLE